MLKILQVRLQQYVNCELPDVQAGLRKGRGTRDQIANICWIIEKAREFQKTSISVLLTMPKPLTVCITTKYGKFFHTLEMGVPDHLTCLLRNLYAGLPVHHQLPEFTHTHVLRVSDAIQPSHPLSSPSPPALNLSQHQVLFK